MRASRTRGALLSRLEQLESRAVATYVIKVRFGHLRRLPPDYKGDRHVVMTKELPNRGGREWAEFEEVPGPRPAPAPSVTGMPRYINVLYVAPYPTQGMAS